MSTVSTIVDAIASELVTNVTTLATANTDGTLQTHKYTPQALDSMELDGQKHLAVWLTPDDPAVITDGAQTGSHQQQMRFTVLYWESSMEGDPGEADETKAATLFTLADAILARFYVSANQTLGSAAGVWRLWLTSWTPDAGGASGVRGLKFDLVAMRTQEFT